MAVDQAIPVPDARVMSSWAARANGAYLIASVSAGGRVMASRVDLAGAPIDTLAIGLDTGASGVAVASDGEDFLVVWNANGIKAARIRGSDGAVLDPMTISTTGSNPGVAFDGKEYLVAWKQIESDTRIRGAIVRDGVLRSPVGGVALATSEAKPGYGDHPAAVTAGNSDFLITWDHYALRVNEDGSALGDTIVLPSNQYGDWYGTPGAAFDGSNFDISWTDFLGGNVWGVRLSDATGKPIGSPTQLTSDSGWDQPRVLFDGKWFIVAAKHSVNSESHVRAMRVDPRTGQRSDDPSGPYRDLPVEIPAYDIVWNIDIVPGLVVHGAVGGTFIDTDGVLTPATPSHPLYHVGHEVGGYAVASNGTDYLVVWADRRKKTQPTAWDGADWDVYGARVRGSDHAVLDPQGFLIGPGAKLPAVASDGHDYVVAYTVQTNGAGGYLGTRRVHATDGSLDPELFAGQSDMGTRPSIACDGTNYFLVYDAYNFGYGMSLRRIGVASGTFIDNAPMYITADYPDLGVGMAVNTAAPPDARSILLAWWDRQTVKTARLSPETGAVLGGPGNFTTVSHTVELGAWLYPTAVSTGTDFVVAWADQRLNSSAPRQFYATRVSADGTVLDGVDPSSNLAGLNIATAEKPFQWYSMQGPYFGFDGTSLVLTWSEGNQAYLRAARFTPQLSPLDSHTGFPITGPLNTDPETDGFGRWDMSAAIVNRPNGETMLTYGRYNGKGEAPLGTRIKATFLSNLL